MVLNSQFSTPFDLLQETPRPYLDSDAIKAKFLALSAPLHPDRVHHLSEDQRKEATRRFSELNSAYVILREHRDRINLLLELETGSKPKDIQKIPPGTMDLFVEIGQFCRDLDGYLSTRNSSESSPLLKAVTLKQQQDWMNRLDELRKKIDLKDATALSELKSLDDQWISTTDHKPILEKLENIARLFSYITRWRQQIAERSIQLKTS